MYITEKRGDIYACVSVCSRGFSINRNDSNPVHPRLLCK